MPNLIEEQPENGGDRVEVGVRVTGRQPQQMKQTRIASLTTGYGTRQSYNRFLYTIYTVGLGVLAQFADQRTVCTIKLQHPRLKSDLETFVF